MNSKLFFLQRKFIYLNKLVRKGTTWKIDLKSMGNGKMELLLNMLTSRKVVKVLTDIIRFTWFWQILIGKRVEHDLHIYRWPRNGRNLVWFNQRCCYAKYSSAQAHCKETKRGTPLERGMHEFKRYSSNKGCRKRNRKK